jgi:hypothetical protein
MRVTRLESSNRSGTSHRTHGPFLILLLHLGFHSCCRHREEELSEVNFALEKPSALYIRKIHSFGTKSSQLQSFRCCVEHTPRLSTTTVPHHSNMSAAAENEVSCARMPAALCATILSLSLPGRSALCVFSPVPLATPLACECGWCVGCKGLHAAKKCPPRLVRVHPPTSHTPCPPHAPFLYAQELLDYDDEEAEVAEVSSTPDLLSPFGHRRIPTEVVLPPWHANLFLARWGGVRWTLAGRCGGPAPRFPISFRAVVRTRSKGVLKNAPGLVLECAFACRAARFGSPHSRSCVPHSHFPLDVQ